MLIHAMALTEAYFCYRILKELTGIPYVKLYLKPGYNNEPNRFITTRQEKLENVLEIENEHAVINNQTPAPYGTFHPINYVKMLQELGECIYQGKKLNTKKRFRKIMKNAKKERAKVRKEAFAKLVQKAEHESKEAQQTGEGSSGQQPPQQQ